MASVTFTRREGVPQLLSAAGLRGCPVLGHDGALVGHLVDVVVRAGAAFPPLAGLILTIGSRTTWVHAEDVASIAQDRVVLQVVKLDLTDVVRRGGEIQLLGDVLDHQLVDVHGVRVVRASDLYLTMPHEQQWRLVGVETSWRTVMRRALGGSWARRANPRRVLEWTHVATFGVTGGFVPLESGRDALPRLRPGELAGLLEDLGRAERRSLLSSLPPETAADALEEMDPRHRRALLRDADLADAAELIGAMEPDDAVETLRELPEDEREDVLNTMPDTMAGELTKLLEFEEDTAAGVMTTAVVIAGPDTTVAQAVALLRDQAAHSDQHLTVLVVDDAGALIDEVTPLDLLGAPEQVAISGLLREPWPVTVHRDAGLGEVIDAMRSNRGQSLVVVDDDQRPLGRILADDVIDALVGAGTHWP